jgi:hypothetical protein
MVEENTASEQSRTAASEERPGPAKRTRQCKDLPLTGGGPCRRALPTPHLLPGQPRLAASDGTLTARRFATRQSLRPLLWHSSPQAGTRRGLSGPCTSARFALDGWTGWDRQEQNEMRGTQRSYQGRPSTTVTVAYFVGLHGRAPDGRCLGTQSWHRLARRLFSSSRGPRIALVGGSDLPAKNNPPKRFHIRSSRPESTLPFFLCPSLFLFTSPPLA